VGFLGLYIDLMGDVLAGEGIDTWLLLRRGVHILLIILLEVHSIILWRQMMELKRK
jgi:hypothetical protein